MALTALQRMIREFWHGPLEVAKPEPLGPDERFCPETGRVTTCMEDCHPRGANCTNGVNTENIEGTMMEILREAFTEEERPAIMRELATGAGPPNPIPDELFDAFMDGGPPPKIELRDAMRLYRAQGLPIREIVDRMTMEGYNAKTLLLGYDPGAEVAEPMATFTPEATEDLETGDLVVMDDNGNARRALEGERVIGVALGDGRIRFTGGGAFTDPGIHMSAARPMHMSTHYGSMAYQASIIGGYGRGFPRNIPAPARYQYNERFPKEVVDKAMALLAKFMSTDQYKAFMEGSLIELQNKAEDHRIMINRNGKFSILKGPRGAGIMMTSGNVGSYKYPIGDEIAVFLDWFRFRTRELIDRWKCGTYTITDGDLR